MRKVINILSVMVMCLMAGPRAQAQVLAPNDAGVALAEWHTVVRDLDAAKRFWALMGGQAIKVDGTDVMKFPGILVFLTPGAPTGGSEGNVVNHLGFYVPSVRDLTEKLKAGGVKLDFVEGPKVVTGNDICWVYSPDDLKIELHSEKALPGDLRTALHADKAFNYPIAGSHVHFGVVESSMREMQTWYVKTFGGTAEKTITGLRISGLSGGFSVGKSATATTPTKGRTLDYIGFEVVNLDAFCKKLEAQGVKFEEPYSKTRHKSFASAKFTDPFGVTIELTEGLSRL